MSYFQWTNFCKMIGRLPDGTKIKFFEPKCVSEADEDIVHFVINNQKINKKTSIKKSVIQQWLKLSTWNWF